jgi:phosphopantetheinyl transferase
LFNEAQISVDAMPEAALPRFLTVFDAQERAAARSPRAALAIWSTKEAALKAAGALLGNSPVSGCAGE